VKLRPYGAVHICLLLLLLLLLLLNKSDSCLFVFFVQLDKKVIEGIAVGDSTYDDKSLLKASVSVMHDRDL